MSDFKRIYAIRRNPAVPVTRFADRWRQHALLAQGFPDIVREYPRLAYCLVRHDLAADCPGLSDAFDGIGLLWMSDLAVRGNPGRDPGISPTMREDELKVFTGYVADSSGVLEQVTAQGEDGNGFALLTLLRGADLEQVADHDAGLRAALGTRLRRQVRSRMGEGASVEATALVEHWFDTAEDAQAAAAVVTYARVAPDSHTLLVEVANAWQADSGWSVEARA